MRVTELTGTEREYWLKVAQDNAVKYGVVINDFRVYEKGECITFNSSNRNTYVLSNFYPCDLVYNDIHFHSSEQLYHYLCTTTKPELQRLIMEQPNALAVKKLHIGYEDRDSTWLRNRIGIMRTVLRTKYHQCKEYRDFLLSTGDKELLEYAYWWDLYWGASTKASSRYYVGVNALGRLHMELRYCIN